METNFGYIANLTTSFLEIPGEICCSVYFTGCSFNCDGCQNKELQNIMDGKKMLITDVIEKINDNKLIKWVCFLGGEPFFQSSFLKILCEHLDKPIGIYTGYNYHELYDKFNDIINIKNIKFLKTGKYVKQLVKEGEFPISSNQISYYKKNDIWNKIETRNNNDVAEILQDI